MDWRYAAVVVGASVVASFTDWLFMGVLFHEKYLHAPEIWRTHPQLVGTPRIIYSQVIGLITCAAFAYLLLALEALTLLQALEVALLVWATGAVVILGQMVLWVKLHPLIGVSHALGWLSRLVITALFAVWLMGASANLAPAPV
jgi:hypothetical protein